MSKIKNGKNFLAMSTLLVGGLLACKPTGRPAAEARQGSPPSSPSPENPADQAVFSQRVADDAAAVELYWFDRDALLTWETAAFRGREVEVWASADMAAEPPTIKWETRYELGDRLMTEHQLIYRGTDAELRLPRTSFQAFWLVVTEPGGGVQPDVRRAQVPADLGSCRDLQTNWPELASGTYQIHLQQSDYMVYCDMSTGKGGWTLVLDYQKKPGLARERRSLVGDFPKPRQLLVSGSAGSPLEGHAVPSLVAELKPQAIRFHCESSRHDRRLEFITRQGKCLEYLASGRGNCANLTAAWSSLAGHSAVLPEDMGGGLADQGEFAMLEIPFGQKDGNSWLIANPKRGWACDAPPFQPGDQDWLQFQVWVR